MSLDRAAGVLLIFLPIAFNTFFFLLARLFDYPSVLRGPVGAIRTAGIGSRSVG